MKKKLLLVLVVLAMLCLSAACAAEQTAVQTPEVNRAEYKLVIAGGPQSGIYYPLGNVIAEILNGVGYQAEVIETQGSVNNIALLKSGEAQLAIAMSDAIFQANDDSLRALSPLYPNYIQVITTDNSAIVAIPDLAGKKVSIGKENSGIAQNAEQVLAAYGLSLEDFEPVYLDYQESCEALTAGEIEAAFVTSGLGNPAVSELADSQSVRLIAIDGDAAAQLLQDYSFMSADEISAATYGLAEPCATVSMLNMLLVSQDLPETVVYDICCALSANLDIIHQVHEVVSELDLKRQELILPYHNGAEKFFELGMPTE